MKTVNVGAVTCVTREALVVGINTYTHRRFLKLNQPANDAEAVARILYEYGNFGKITRLPVTTNKEDDKTQYPYRVDPQPKYGVSHSDLEKALTQLFRPGEKEGHNFPDTALFYFSGHGWLHKTSENVQDSYLAFTDADPDRNYGISLKWLRDVLNDSPVRQQVVILDCCYSGQLINLQNAEPSGQGRGRDRCFIAASREYEQAFTDSSASYSFLTEALLKGLDPHQAGSKGFVTSQDLILFLQQECKISTQQPIFHNPYGPIELTRLKWDPPQQPSPVPDVTCPYKGLDYFTEDDADNFYGRSEETKKLRQQVKQNRFTAVLGSSGSGKSSLLRAGLLHQLKQEQGEQWQVLLIDRPSDDPLSTLAEKFTNRDWLPVTRATEHAKAIKLLETDASGLQLLLHELIQDTNNASSANTPLSTKKVLLVVDQLEEVFTLCTDETKQKQFFQCLFDEINRSSSRLHLVFAMRSDFFGKLADLLSKLTGRNHEEPIQKLEKGQVLVGKMNRNALSQVITKPAQSVGLKLEEGLVNLILQDIGEEPGALPLLQHVLKRLWESGHMNLTSYTNLTSKTNPELRGLQGVLEEYADEKYQALLENEQKIADRIFLALIHVGEGTGDTRRQRRKEELITKEAPAEQVEKVIQQLVEAKLLVTSDVASKSPRSSRIPVVDIAHEVLIRYWTHLQKLVTENRPVLQKWQLLEDAANEWSDLESMKKQEPAYLLQGSKLAEAEQLIKSHGDILQPSELLFEFIRTSQGIRKRQIQIKTLVISLLVGTAVLSLITLVFYYLQSQRTQRLLQLARASVGLLDKLETLQLLPITLNEAKSYAQSGKKEEATTFYRYTLVSAFKLNKERFKENSFYNTAENDFVKFLESNQIKNLKDVYLEKSKFGGTRKSDDVTTDINLKFNEGALKETYKTLVVDFGADMDGDGLLNEEEAHRTPCEIVQLIENAWRDATRKINGKSCGWYNLETGSYTVDQDCKELDGRTLMGAVFEQPSFFNLRKQFKETCHIKGSEKDNLYE